MKWKIKKGENEKDIRWLSNRVSIGVKTTRVRRPAAEILNIKHKQIEITIKKCNLSIIHRYFLPFSIFASAATCQRDMHLMRK